MSVAWRENERRMKKMQCEGFGRELVPGGKRRPYLDGDREDLGFTKREVYKDSNQVKE
jgi:hypothetical protein